MSTRLNADRCRQAIKGHTAMLAEAAVAAGPEATVPTAPDWQVAALVEHVGQTLNWVSEIVEDRITDPTRLPTEVAAMPADPRTWPDWLGEGSSRATAAVSDAALEAPVFNAAGDERTGAWFWLQSMLNEAVIHGFDATAAAAGTVAGADEIYDIDAAVAADLVTNHLAMLTSPTWAFQRPESATALRGNGETLHWHATDDDLGASGEWFVERRPEGVTWQHHHGPADVTVHGPARSLLLVLTRRLPLADGYGDVRVDGDVDLARHWLDHSAHVAG
jgi:MDMPI C-terminal domain/Mycothiol maleylpyruvate isomerase N-terminal domain